MSGMLNPASCRPECQWPRMPNCADTDCIVPKLVLMKALLLEVLFESKLQFHTVI